jgi:hypothetical protein
MLSVALSRKGIVKDFVRCLSGTGTRVGTRLQHRKLRHEPKIANIEMCLFLCRIYRKT